MQIENLFPTGEYGDGGRSFMVKSGTYFQKVADLAGGVWTLTTLGLSLQDTLGTTTNDAAVAGGIGELLSGTIATGSSVSLTTATAANVTSVSLTAGDWDVSGTVDYNPGATTSITRLAQGVSSISATLGAQDTYSQSATAANVPTAVVIALPTPVTRISLAATTTIYLVASATFTVSTLTAFGTIRARRVR